MAAGTALHAPHTCRSRYLPESAQLGGLPTFANLVTNSETTPIAAVRRTSGIDGAAERSFADAPLGGPIDNLWWPVPITV